MSQASLERRDPIASQAAVGLDLALAGASGPDPTSESLEVRPQAPHPRQVVLELGQLDLQLALGAVGVGGEDVEDDRRAVDHRDAERGLEVAFLARRQLVVAGHEIRVRRGDLGLHVLELSGAEVRVGMRALTALDELADGRHPCGAQQLFEFGEVWIVAGRDRSDHQRALTRASLRLRAAARRPPIARFRVRHYRGW